MKNVKTNIQAMFNGRNSVVPSLLDQNIEPNTFQQRLQQLIGLISDRVDYVNFIIFSTVNYVYYEGGEWGV